MAERKNKSSRALASKFIFASAAAAATMIMGPQALAQEDPPERIIVSGSEEIGYAPGSLGYAAIMRADYDTAMEQILEAEGGVENPENVRDPARLLNLAHIMVKKGRYAEARMLYDAAASKRSFYIVLDDGTVVNSRRAARQALADMESHIQLASK